MGSALLGFGGPMGAASGDFFSFAGGNDDTITEDNCEISATEGATFSNLRVQNRSGGSGTNTYQFRDTNANGNQVVAFSGAGISEDTTNSDTLTAADTFAIAYTDTGTDSAPSWVVGNVSFSSGHGCFHVAASYAGVVWDVASATRFHGFSGSMFADGLATEAQAGWKCRGYDSMAAVQCFVSANARVTDSTFRNRINSANGSGSTTIGAGVTGLFTITGLSDAITDGQIANASIETGTGVEDLTITFFGGTLKSSTSKQDIWAGFPAASRTASATAHYSPILGRGQTGTTFTEAQAAMKLGFAGTISNLRCYLSVNTYTSDGTLKLYVNGAAAITLTLEAAGGAKWYENSTDTVAVVATDTISLEWDEGGTGGITPLMAGFTVAPAGGANPKGIFGLPLDGPFRRVVYQ